MRCRPIRNKSIVFTTNRPTTKTSKRVDEDNNVEFRFFYLRLWLACVSLLAICWRGLFVCAALHWSSVQSRFFFARGHRFVAYNCNTTTAMSSAAAAGGGGGSKAGVETKVAAAAAAADEEERPQVEYVTLKSGDGHEFRVLKEAAILSGAIRAMLASDFAEAQGVIEFKEISKPILEKIVQ